MGLQWSVSHSCMHTAKAQGLAPGSYMHIFPLLWIWLRIPLPHHLDKLMVVDPSILQTQRKSAKLLPHHEPEILMIFNMFISYIVRISIRDDFPYVLSVVQPLLFKGLLKLFNCNESERQHIAICNLLAISLLIGLKIHVPAIIFVKILKCRVQMIFFIDPVHVYCCSDELVIVYRSISICICL